MVASVAALAVLLVGSFATADGSAAEWTDANFDTNLASRGGRAFVMFFAPWCGHCKALKPVWDMLADGTVASMAAIVKVDCTESGQALCKKHNVGGYPTLKFFSVVGGAENVVDYDGGRKQEDLESFVLENTRPALTQLQSHEEAAAFVVSPHQPVVVGYFGHHESALQAVFTSLSEVFRKSFKMGYTLSEATAKQMGQKLDTVVLYWPPQYHTKMEPDWLTESSPNGLESFLQNHKHPIAAMRTPSNEQDFNFPLVTVFLGLDPVQHRSAFRQLRNRMITVARKHPSLTFVISKHADYSEFLTEFRDATNPSGIYLVAYDRQRRKFVFPEDLSTQDSTGFQSSLELFVGNFLKGNVYEAHIKSQPVPPEGSNEGPVKVIVGRTFEEVVQKSGNKDVLIEFYAPWCGHCKKLEPIYNSLGKVLADEKHLVIAKIDATANEFPPHFKVRGFPTIRLHKASPEGSTAGSVVPFEGERNLKGFVEFLRKHVSTPLQFQGEVPDIKEEL